jgi:hypothetical protein
MLFRPEEVHCASGIAEVFEPFRKRNRHVSVKTQGLLIQHPAVFHFEAKHLAAIQTGKVHPYRLLRE